MTLFLRLKPLCLYTWRNNLVSHSLPASMALWRPMSISFRGKRISQGLLKKKQPTPMSPWLSPGLSPQKGLGELSTPQLGVFSAQNFCLWKKKRLENLWNLMLTKQIPQFMALDGPPSPWHSETSKNIKIWINLEMWRPYGPYDTSKRLVTCKIQLKQGPSEDGRSKE